MSFQTVGTCFINLQYFGIGTHVGGWCCQCAVALLQGQGERFAGFIAVPARLVQSLLRTPNDSYRLTYSLPEL